MNPLALLTRFWESFFRATAKPFTAYAVVFTIACTLLLFISTVAPNLFLYTDERSTDLLWRGLQTDTPERRVVIVDIDEKSIQQLGPWPWPRERIAEILGAIDAQGASLKILDIVFADPNVADGQFALALHASGHSPNIFAQIFSIHGETILRSGVLTGELPATSCPQGFPNAQGYLANFVPFGAAGHLNPQLSFDGAIREVPAFICFDEKVFPSLALAGLAAVSGGLDGVRIHKVTSLLQAPREVRFGDSNELAVPLDSKGNMRVPFWRSRYSFASVSAADLLNGKDDVSFLKNAWVIIGSTAFGLGDAVPTAQGGAVSGIEIHAQILSAILDGRLPYTPRAAQFWFWIFSVFFLVALFWFFRQPTELFGRARVVLLPIVGIGVFAIAFLVHALALISLNWFIGWSHAGSFALLMSSGLAIYSHGRSRFENRVIFRALSSHLPTGVAAEIAHSESLGQSSISAQRKEVTVLYADLRNFSAFCQQRSAEESARVLHDFLVNATAIVERHQGVVEHMVGDSLLAVWNGSLPCPEHAQNALQAAQELWGQSHRQLACVSVGPGLEPLDLGIGIESGDAVIGIFGPSDRRTHTILGETVTVAVQLQSLTQELASPILVGDGVAKRVNYNWISLGFFLLPGLTESRPVFCLSTISKAQGQDRIKMLEAVRSKAA